MWKKLCISSEDMSAASHVHRGHSILNLGKIGSGSSNIEFCTEI